MPANVIAVVNPCHIRCEINDWDKEYYYKSLRFDGE
ncbi:MAG: hypothetical protein ACJAYB_002706 [Psychromonas sp.]|jgi:hypothetical protein